MPSDFDKKSQGDIILFGRHRRPHKIARIIKKGNIVVLQELDRDSIGRLYSIGEEGRFSTTFAEAQAAPLLRKKKPGEKIGTRGPRKERMTQRMLDMRGTGRGSLL